MAKYTKVIACDGPARAGKTTLARNFEQRLGIPCLATGNIYRALTVLLLDDFKTDSLVETPDEVILEALAKYDTSRFRCNFSGEVFFEDNAFAGLSAPLVSANAWRVARIPDVRSQLVEPLVIKMIDECNYPLVFSEGRDEGRLWKEAGHLGVAIFLSVDPLVAALRERMMRISQKREIPELREIMSNIMRYDLDNASRNIKPTYIDDEVALFTGKIDKNIKQALAKKHQIIVPTSSIDATTVFQRVVRLAQVADVFEKTNNKLQTSLLEL